MATTDASNSPSSSRWWHSDSLGVFFCVALLSLVAAHLWSVWVHPPFNSEHLGIDACQHAILIYCQSLPDKSEQALLADVLATYPQMSHWLAAQWMPLLGGDPYKAMRTVSAASVLLMLLCQFWLLRRALPAPWAVVALLAWQFVCKGTNTADTQFYCMAYFYAQAVGTNFLWMAVLFLTWPASTRWQAVLLTLLGAGSAALAYLCHIVPGAAVLGGSGLYFLVAWYRSRCRLDLARLVAVAAVGLLVVLGTPQLSYMGDARQSYSFASIKSWTLLMTWVPTLIVVLAALDWRWFRQGEWSPVEKLIGVLACVLLVAGLLQAYCAVEYALGKSALYSVHKLFYVLFPISTMIWVLAGVQWLKARRLLDFPAAQRLLPGWCGCLAAAAVVGGLVVVDGMALVKNELVIETSVMRNEAVAPERHPMQVCRRLTGELAQAAAAQGVAGPADPHWRSDVIYYDADLVHASFFINVVGLRRNWTDALHTEEIMVGWHPGQPTPAQFNQIVPFRRLLLPQDGPMASPPKTLRQRSG
jgi:hypothetical protein